MANHNDTTKTVLGLIVGSVLAAGVAAYTIHSVRTRKTPIVQKIGKTISEVGEALEHCELANCSDVFHRVEKSFPKGKDVLASVLDWLSCGMNVWKQFKKEVK